MEEEKEGIEFLESMYKDLHMSEEVMTFSKEGEDPTIKISRYLEKLKKYHERHPEYIKEFYYKKYIIEELPEGYIELQKRILREQGYGDIEVTEKQKKEMLENIQKDQKESLNQWIEYLCNEESTYPWWFKYYAFQGMIRLGKYDKENQKFQKRTNTTTEKYIDINQEVLSKVYDIINRQIGGKELTEEEVEIIEKGESFVKLYIHFLTDVTKKDYDTTEVKGEWIKYEQGSNYLALYESLQGKNTGWCTAGEDTARSQIRGGDFYVYYTYDNEGKASNPRIAIRMNGKNEIGEIRGVASGQNLEPEMEEVLQEKLKEFPDREEYEKKTKDMKKLTEIEKKQINGIELTEEEIKFLYETEGKIEGFGEGKDPRVYYLKIKRNAKKDLSRAYRIREEEIRETTEEYKINPSNCKLLLGNIYLDSLTSADELELPQTISGDLYLRGLTSAEGLLLPQTIVGSLNLSGLTNAKGLKFPETIVGSLFLENLISAEGLVLPQTIGVGLYLENLTSAKDLVFPKTIGKSLNLEKLIIAEGLVLPQTIGGSLNLSGLTNAKGLKFRETISGDLYLSGLTSAEGLVLPQTIGGSLNLSGLKSAEGLVLPQTIGGSLNLSGLTSAEGLVLPQTIGGALYLENLTSAKDLVFPQTIEGSLNLEKLIIAEGLILPQTIVDGLYLSSLKSAEGLVLPQTIGGSLSLSGLKSTEGLVLPQTIGGSLSLSRLKSAEGLILPQTIEGSLYLSSLTSAEGLVLPPDFDLDKLYCSNSVKEEIISKQSIQKL